MDEHQRDLGLKAPLYRFKKEDKKVIYYLSSEASMFIDSKYPQLAYHRIKHLHS
jgi:hypothetical protein